MIKGPPPLHISMCLVLSCYILVIYYMPWFCLLTEWLAHSGSMLLHEAGWIFMSVEKVPYVTRIRQYHRRVWALWYPRFLTLSFITENSSRVFSYKSISFVEGSDDEIRNIWVRIFQVLHSQKEESLYSFSCFYSSWWCLSVHRIFFLSYFLVLWWTLVQFLFYKFHFIKKMLYSILSCLIKNKAGNIRKRRRTKSYFQVFSFICIYHRPLECETM